eukprot:Amastigsp_a679531_94.p3 type:complete len:158 gc:universal Amastigsp_a679531_94:1070-597(-)
MLLEQHHVRVPDAVLALVRDSFDGSPVRVHCFSVAAVIHRVACVARCSRLATPCTAGCSAALACGPGSAVLCDEHMQQQSDQLPNLRATAHGVSIGIASDVDGAGRCSYGEELHRPRDRLGRDGDLRHPNRHSRDRAVQDPARQARCECRRVCGQGQ